MALAFQNYKAETSIHKGREKMQLTKYTFVYLSQVIFCAVALRLIFSANVDSLERILLILSIVCVSLVVPFFIIHLEGLDARK